MLGAGVEQAEISPVPGCKLALVPANYVCPSVQEKNLKRAWKDRQKGRPEDYESSRGSMKQQIQRISGLKATWPQTIGLRTNQASFIFTVPREKGPYILHKRTPDHINKFFSYRNNWQSAEHLLDTQDKTSNHTLQIKWTSCSSEHTTLHKCLGRH